MADVHPFKDVIEEDRTIMISEFFRILQDDGEFTICFLDFLIEILEADFSLDYDALLQDNIQAVADFVEEIYDEGMFRLPESTVNPDIMLRFMFVAHDPIDSGALAAMPRPHQDYTFGSYLFLHHLDSAAQRHQNIRICHVLAHVLHQYLYQVMWGLASFLVFCTLNNFRN